VALNTDYLCAVGSVIDSSSNEQAFHHLKLRLSDGNDYSALYK